LNLILLIVKFLSVRMSNLKYNKIMKTSKVINVDENSTVFLLDLERRIKLAKNPKNRTSLSRAKKDILKKYREFAGVKV
jgi:hypothetical protein